MATLSANKNGGGGGIRTRTPDAVTSSQLQELSVRPNTMMEKRRAKTLSERCPRLFISSARRTMQDIFELLDSDKTYELYVALAGKVITNLEVRDPVLNMTPLTKICCAMPLWDSRKRNLWIKIFVRFGANVNATNENGQTILAQLIVLKKENVFCQLSEADKKVALNFLAVDNDDNNLLHLAAYNGLLKACNIILARTSGYGNPLYEHYNQRGQTPLIIACEGGDIAMAKTLIEAGADLTIREANCRYGSQMAIEILETTLLRNKQDGCNDDDIKMILERLIRSSCKYMTVAGQLSKMARLLRWCANSVLGQTKASELCNEFRPAKPTQPLVYTGPLPSKASGQQQPQGKTSGRLSKRPQSPHQEQIILNEPVFDTKQFDLPPDLDVEPKENDKAPSAEQSQPNSVIYSLLDYYSYLWTPSYMNGALKTAEKVRLYEREHLINSCFDKTEEDAMEPSEMSSRMTHSRMSVFGKMKGGVAPMRGIKRMTSASKFKQPTAEAGGF